MDRRDFFKILSTSATAVGASCGRKSDKLIPLLVPEREIVPGEEQWHPAVCAECAAGCATIVRVMEGVRTVQRNGEPARERIAAIKKIEGNPLDPVSGGRLCARGQASVQGLYHPDRLRGPMQRSGDRGKAQFTAIPWDEAIATVAARVRAADPERVVFLTGPQTGTRSRAIARFQEALRAPAPVVCPVADFAVERKAAELVFGWKGLPVYDLSGAHHVLGVGADFLGGWTSPVYYGRQFGQFRQGRGTVRGHLAQAESRMSLTAGAADRWLPLRPGSELQFLLAVGHLLLGRNNKALPPRVLDAFQSADVAGLLVACGLDERRVRDAVRQLAESEAPLVLAGASIVHTNSVDAVAASHYINLMLGNVGKRVLPPAGPAAESRAVPEALARAQVVFIDGANPAYTMPRSTGVLDALARAGTIVSFVPFLDDSGAWADLLLPDHHALESEMAVVNQAGVSMAIPFVVPLYDTRAVEKTLAEVAKKMEVPYAAVTPQEVVQPFLPDGMTYEDAARQGGVWRESSDAKTAAPPAAAQLNAAAASFNGDPGQYPLLFQPYLSLQFHDGRGANLPWLQEMPDPASSSIWGLPVEIDTKTAAILRIANGDLVRVESAHGAIEAPAYVHPGAAPNVVSMAIGDGHTHYGRYASGRGSNPLSILAPVWEASSGALAVGGTRVRLARAGGRGKWIQFSAPDREELHPARR